MNSSGISGVLRRSLFLLLLQILQLFVCIFSLRTVLRDLAYQLYIQSNKMLKPAGVAKVFLAFKKTNAPGELFSCKSQQAGLLVSRLFCYVSIPQHCSSRWHLLLTWGLTLLGDGWCSVCFWGSSLCISAGFFKTFHHQSQNYQQLLTWFSYPVVVPAVANFTLYVVARTLMSLFLIFRALNPCPHYDLLKRHFLQKLFQLITLSSNLNHASLGRRSQDEPI